MGEDICNKKSTCRGTELRAVRSEQTPHPKMIPTLPVKIHSAALVRTEMQMKTTVACHHSRTRLAKIRDEECQCCRLGSNRKSLTKPWKLACPLRIMSNCDPEPNTREYTPVAEQSSPKGVLNRSGVSVQQREVFWDVHSSLIQNSRGINQPK